MRDIRQVQVSAAWFWRLDFASLCISPRANFAPLTFFLFLVGRYSVDFAPPCRHKLSRRLGFVRGGGAIFAGFRPGGGTLFVPGGAK